MESPKRTLAMLAILAVLVGVLVVVWMRANKPGKPPPTGGQFYYTGPMRNKSDPTKFTTDAGQVVAPPPGVSAEPVRPTPSMGFAPDAVAGSDTDKKK